MAEAAVRPGLGGAGLSRAPSFLPTGSSSRHPAQDSGAEEPLATGSLVRPGSRMGWTVVWGDPWAVLWLGGPCLLFLLCRKLPRGLPSSGGTSGCWGAPRPEGPAPLCRAERMLPPPRCSGMHPLGGSQEWRSQSTPTVPLANRVTWVCVLSVLVGKMGSQGYTPLGLLGGTEPAPKAGPQTHSSHLAGQ